MTVFGVSLWWIVGSLLVVLVVLWLCRRWLRKKVKRLLTSRLVTTVIIPLIAVIPVLMINASDERHHLWPSGFWTNFRSWLNVNPPVATIAFFWPIAVIFGGYVLGKVRERIAKLDELTAKEYGFVLHSIDNAAGQKMTRFANAAGRVCKPNPDLPPLDIFQTITQPIAQRAVLVDGIYQIFRLDAESAEAGSGDLVSVKLALIKSGMFERFETWLPGDHAPNSDATQLRRNDCSLSLVAKSREGIVIEDIKSELAKGANRRFTQGAAGSSDTGSLISFPVIHQATNDVPYVVTVRSENAHHFKVNQIARYKRLLRPFLIRISIEHSLSLLKEYHERPNR
jgi:hypothetical protein